MCEVGVFPNFLENDLSKVHKILRLTFFKARKYFEGLKTEFFSFTVAEFFAREMFTTPVYSCWRGRFVNSSFPNKKEHFVKKRSSFMTNKEESNVCRSSTFQVNRTKNATGKRRLTLSNRATMSALHRKNDTTNLFGYKLGELTEINKALIFFSGKKTIQFLQLGNCHVWKFCKDLNFAHIFNAWFDSSIKSYFLMVSFLIL